MIKRFWHFNAAHYVFCFALFHKAFKKDFVRESTVSSLVIQYTALIHYIELNSPLKVFDFENYLLHLLYALQPSAISLFRFHH